MQVTYVMSPAANTSLPCTCCLFQNASNHLYYNAACVFKGNTTNKWLVFKQVTDQWAASEGNFMAPDDGRDVMATNTCLLYMFIMLAL